MLAQLQQLWPQLSSDPVLLYSLAAAALLVTVSLSSGLARADVLALAHPRTLVRVLGAVALAFVLRVLAESWQGDQVPTVLAAILPGLHRFPLYLVALAYGPTTGLFTGAMFAAFASSTLLPGAPEAILALELMVLGWLAIYPSPRITRLAGPFNAGLAYVLAWGTAGISQLAAGGGAITFALVFGDHRQTLPGLAFALGLLLLLGPRVYLHAFPGSRIAPETAASGQAKDAMGPRTVEEPQLLAPDYVEPVERPRRERLRPAFAAQAELGGDGSRNTRVRRLTPRTLPDDDLSR